MQAATQGHVDVAELLLLAMNGTQAQDALLWAASEGYVQIVRGLVESRSAVGAGGKAGVSLSAKMRKMGKTGTTGTMETEETLMVSYRETTYVEQQGKAGGGGKKKGGRGEGRAGHTDGQRWKHRVDDGSAARAT